MPTSVFKIAKQPIEVESGVISHLKRARRIPPEKTERANQEVGNLLALNMIQPSLSPG